MEYTCNNCTISNLIEEKRLKLNILAKMKNLYLLDAEVVNLSQLLDELLVECIACKNRLKLLKKEEKSDNIFGIHSTFFYYGLAHLFLNLCIYINEGIKKNEKIYISMDYDLYNKLLEILQLENVPTKNMQFLSVKELVLSHKKGGLASLKQTINDFVNQALAQGANGIRWIGQPFFAIQETSKEDFLNWEVDLSNAFKDTKASIICIYDAYDYMHNKKFIDEKIIKESLESHTHILSKFLLNCIIKTEPKTKEFGNKAKKNSTAINHENDNIGFTQSEIMKKQYGMSASGES